MNLLLSMPAGAEWITLIILGLLFIVFPVFALLYFLRNRKLKRQLEKVTKERDDLLNNMII